MHIWSVHSASLIVCGSTTMNAPNLDCEPTRLRQKTINLNKRTLIVTQKLCVAEFVKGQNLLHYILRSPHALITFISYLKNSSEKKKTNRNKTRCASWLGVRDSTRNSKSTFVNLPLATAHSSHNYAKPVVLFVGRNESAVQVIEQALSDTRKKVNQILNQPPQLAFALLKRQCLDLELTAAGLLNDFVQ